MQFISISAIEVRDRQRSEASIDKGSLLQLAESIEQKGLLHPPVAWLEGQKHVLLAGRRRLGAISLLHEEKRLFFCNGFPVPAGEVPVTLVTDLSAADLAEAELEENLLRVDLTWQDRAQALAKIHELRAAANPQQTFKQTAEELSQKAQGARGTSTAQLRSRIRESVVITQHLHKPAVAKARTHEEALQIILKDEGAALEAELIRRRLASAESLPALCQVRHGSCLEILPQLAEGQFDLILGDPPYGIKASEGGFRDRTVHHHNYEDTPEVARDLMQAIITEGFRLSKPRANLFMFGDIDYFGLFKTLAGQMGWTPFRTPIIWQKSDSEGLAPWGRQGFRRTYEVIFYATKGQRGLFQSPVDILRYNRVSRADRVYGAEKPVDLLEAMIECSTLPGEYVLDPCCGSGSTLAACRRLKRRALGIELDLDAYNLSCVAAERDHVDAQLQQQQAKMETLA